MVVPKAGMEQGHWGLLSSATASSWAVLALWASAEGCGAQEEASSVCILSSCSSRTFWRYYLMAFSFTHSLLCLASQCVLAECWLLNS